MTTSFVTSLTNRQERKKEREAFEGVKIPYRKRVLEGIRVTKKGGIQRSSQRYKERREILFYRIIERSKEK